MSTNMVKCVNPAHTEKNHLPTSTQGVECALRATGRPNEVTSRVTAAPPAPAAPVVEEEPVFYVDLSSNAKDAVKERISRERWDSGEMRETFEELAGETLKEAGLEYEKGSLTHSDLYSQGGHPSFAATGRLDLGEHGSHDVEVTVRNRGGSSTGVDVEFSDDDPISGADVTTGTWATAHRAARDEVSGLVEKLFWKMRAADEVSDEDAADYLDANDVTLDEDGNFL